MKEEIKSGIISVPGYFYDLIVYYSSFFTFLFIVISLFVGFDNIRNITKSMSIFEWFGVSVLILSVGYSWGQLSSTLSYHIVKRPTTYLVKKIKPCNINDYLFSFDDIVSQLDVKDILKGKQHRNYWTIIYYLQIIYPHIGSDLLKRYARCKLARVNGFNFIVLIIIGAILCISSFSIYYIQWPTYFVMCVIFTVLFFFEFYQRQCWFGDLVIKTLSAAYSACEDMKDKYLTPRR